MSYQSLIQQASSQMIDAMGIQCVITRGNQSVYNGKAIFASAEKSVDTNGQKVIKTCYTITLPADLKRGDSVQYNDEFYIVGNTKNGRDSSNYLRTYIITRQV